MNFVQMSGKNSWQCLLLMTVSATVLIIRDGPDDFWGHGFLLVFNGRQLRGGTREEARKQRRHVKRYRPNSEQQSRSESINYPGWVVKVLHSVCLCDARSYFLHHRIIQRSGGKVQNYSPRMRIESSFFITFSRRCWNLEKSPNQSYCCSLEYLSSQ